MRTIHSERYCRLRCLRPEYANFRPRSTASLADRYSLDFVRKYPLARSNIFLRLARRFVPRFTRGIVLLLFYFDLRRLEVGDCGSLYHLFTRRGPQNQIAAHKTRARAPAPQKT